MKEIIDRIKSPLNTFWRRFRKVALYNLVFWQTIELTADKLIDNDSYADWVQHIATHVKVASIVGAGIAQLTRKDNEDK